jgi:hypothetical protein
MRKKKNLGDFLKRKIIKFAEQLEERVGRKELRVFELPMISKS